MKLLYLFAPDWLCALRVNDLAIGKLFQAKMHKSKIRLAGGTHVGSDNCAIQPAQIQQVGLIYNMLQKTEVCQI